MPVQFLEFDLSEDGADGFSASALAFPAARHTPALVAQVQSLLQALQAELGSPGALDEGHRWDLELNIETEAGEVLTLAQLAQSPPIERISLSLHLAGDDALRHILLGWIDA